MPPYVSANHPKVVYVLITCNHMPLFVIAIVNCGSTAESFPEQLVDVEGVGQRPLGQRSSGCGSGSPPHHQQVFPQQQQQQQQQISPDLQQGVDGSNPVGLITNKSTIIDELLPGSTEEDESSSSVFFGVKKPRNGGAVTAKERFLASDMQQKQGLKPHEHDFPPSNSDFKNALPQNAFDLEVRFLASWSFWLTLKEWALFGLHCVYVCAAKLGDW